MANGLHRLCNILAVAAVASCGPAVPADEDIQKRGAVNVSQAEWAVPMSSLDASFKIGPWAQHEAALEAENTCIVEQIGSCVTRVCERPNWLTFARNANESSGWRSADAGTVGVYGGSWDAEVSPDPGPNYAIVQRESLLFLDGEPLLFVATGDEVPAFAAVVEVPTRIEPLGEELYGNCFPLTEDLELAWTAGAVGEVVFAVGEDTFLDMGDTHIQSLMCSFDASAGNAIIPAKVLSVMVGESLAASLSVTSRRTLTLTDGWEVTLSISETRDTCGGFFDI